MRKAYTLFFSIALGIMLACNSGANSKNEITADTTAVMPEDYIDISKTDSIELYHYADPANQKAFDRTLIKDSVFIQQVGHYILDAAVQRTPCANDFKLFLYRNGEVYKTIYAATADTCRYFAYVINGQSFFRNLNDSAKVLLKDQLKQ